MFIVLVIEVAVKVIAAAVSLPFLSPLPRFLPYLP